jgi:hypothetical protein
MSFWLGEEVSPGAEASWIRTVTTLAIQLSSRSRYWISEQDRGMGRQVSIESSGHSTGSQWLGHWIDTLVRRCTVGMWYTTVTQIGEV